MPEFHETSLISPGVKFSDHFSIYNKPFVTTKKNVAV